MPSTWNSWSATEEAMLCAHYPERGPRWAGWAEILGGRSYHAIVTHASKLGLHAPDPMERKRNERGARRGDVGQPAEHERRVKDCMAAGMTPCEIDSKMHWPEGRAMGILAEIWSKDTGR